MLTSVLPVLKLNGWEVLEAGLFVHYAKYKILWDRKCLEVIIFENVFSFVIFSDCEVGRFCE